MSLTEFLPRTISERESLEIQLLKLFGNKLIATEDAFNIINAYKSSKFAFSQIGMMLYSNGHNLRGLSINFPNGLVYFDGQNIFGIGIFKKEQANDQSPHLMIVAPQGPNHIQAVLEFISIVRKNKIFNNEIYIRHLCLKQKEEFLAAGMNNIESSPWHLDAPEEDEHFPNRVFYLNDIFELSTNSEILINNLPYEDAKNFKRKPRLLHNRFTNYLERNDLEFVIENYTYTKEQIKEAKAIVSNYFQSRSQREGALGSTAEDYFSIIFQKPSGINGQNYFAYIGRLQSIKSSNQTINAPVMFFVGERLGENNKAALYATISSRFEEDATKHGLPIDGYTALPQFCTLEVMKKMFRRGIEIVDIGGSETEGLDTQKRQLGGRAEKSYWVVSN